jgi:preprotein translocase subunit SecG
MRDGSRDQDKIMFRIILTVIQVFSAFAIIGLVLLQRGKGADAGAGFGAGASGTVFGARGASTALSRATAIFAAVFMVNSLALAYMGTKQSEPKTILDQAAESVPKTPAGAAKIPLPAPAPATAPSPVPSSSPEPTATPGAAPAPGAVSTPEGSAPPPK